MPPVAAAVPHRRAARSRRCAACHPAAPCRRRATRRPCHAACRRRRAACRLAAPCRRCAASVVVPTVAVVLPHVADVVPTVDLLPLAVVVLCNKAMQLTLEYCIINSTIRLFSATKTMIM